MKLNLIERVKLSVFSKLNSITWELKILPVTKSKRIPKIKMLRKFMIVCFVLLPVWTIAGW